MYFVWLDGDTLYSWCYRRRNLPVIRRKDISYQILSMNLDDLPKEDANTDTDAEAKTDSDTVNNG